MKIKDVQTKLLTVPLNPAIADSTHVLNHVQWILVEIVTDKDLLGNSFMLTFDYGPELLRGIVEVELKKILPGKDPRDISAIWQMCHAHCEYIGQTGVAAWGIAAVDIACGTCWGSNSAFRFVSFSARSANTSRFTAAGGGFPIVWTTFSRRSMATSHAASAW